MDWVSNDDGALRYDVPSSFLSREEFGISFPRRLASHCCAKQKKRLVFIFLSARYRSVVTRASGSKTRYCSENKKEVHPTTPHPPHRSLWPSYILLYLDTAPAMDAQKVWNSVASPGRSSLNTYSFTTEAPPKSANDPGAFRAAVHPAPR